jgi:yecA family protein
MLEAISLDEPVDLGALNDFLASHRASGECMQLSELDGLLAGIAVGPRPIMPSAWLPLVWRDDSPAFDNLEQANEVLGIMVRRFNEIIRLVDAGPGAYQPVFAVDEAGAARPSDWAVGFIQAMGLCQNDWEPLATDPIAGSLIEPIMLIASTTDMANLQLDDDQRLPEPEMERLLAEAGPMLSLCVSAIRRYFQTRESPPLRRKGRKKSRR